MATVTAVIVCSMRAFSGYAATRVVGDVGGRRDGAPRPFGCRTVMIAPVGGRRRRLQLMRAVRTVSGARLPQTYKSQEREGRILYLAT
jgi:hypothetical protein